MPRSRRGRAGCLAATLLALVAGGLLLSQWSMVAANLADPLRALIGNRGVAQLESFLFRVRDTVRQWQYRSGVKEAAAPWQVDASPVAPVAVALKQTGVSEGASNPEGPDAEAPSAAGAPCGDGTAGGPPGVGPAGTEGPAVCNPSVPVQVDRATPPVVIATLVLASGKEPAPSQGPAEGELPSESQNPAATATAESSPTPTSPPAWLPAPAKPFGNVAGEGVWAPYIQDAAGAALAARTFLMPDPERPYSFVAVIAFDLTRTRLNFVLGYEEPALPGGPVGLGVIPRRDLKPGVLLAAFNGAFKATHGGYGAMANDVVPIPARAGIATLVLYDDGRVQIGEWGTDFQLTSDMLAYRQNCLMIVQNGEINPKVFNDSVGDWGGSINYDIVTWRSGLGLSADGATLYYFAGPSLSMPALAAAMQAAGAYQSMLLDINDYWVHFTAIHAKDGKLVAEPLLPEDMKIHIDRYLRPFGKDFFYITAIQP